MPRSSPKNAAAPLYKAALVFVLFGATWGCYKHKKHTPARDRRTKLLLACFSNCPNAGKWGGGGSPSFPARHAPCARARAEEGARAVGRNGSPRHRARRLARARPASTARYVRTTGHAWRTRALQQPPPRPAISAGPVGRRSPPVRSDRPQIPVTFVAKHLRPSIRLCPCVDKTTHAQAESHQRLELLSGAPGVRNPPKGRRSRRPQAVAREQPPSLS